MQIIAAAKRFRVISSLYEGASRIAVRLARGFVAVLITHFADLAGATPPRDCQAKRPGTNAELGKSSGLLFRSAVAGPTPMRRPIAFRAVLAGRARSGCLEI